MNTPVLAALYFALISNDYKARSILQKAARGKPAVERPGILTIDD